LGNVDLASLLDMHESGGGLATVTTVPLKSQYGTVEFNADNRVQRFVEKPTIHSCWINAGYFVFEKRAFDLWRGRNLETDVLPYLAQQGVLYTYQHDGFWKSMDTSKDQQELDLLRSEGAPPWMPISKRSKSAAAD
jgi:glucose-1-phosphate cytidylyltransferase